MATHGIPPLNSKLRAAQHLFAVFVAREPLARVSLSTHGSLWSQVGSTLAIVSWRFARMTDTYRAPLSSQVKGDVFEPTTFGL